MRRQNLNVVRMKLMGAEVVPVTSGTRTLKDATSEAIRDWVTTVNDSHYIIGSVVGPAPYPRMVREFQAIIGREARAQMLERVGRLPKSIVACVGGGSNAMGIFAGFVDDRDVELVGIEAAGEGIDTARHAASRTKAGKLVSVAGGGDTEAALHHAGVSEDFTYVSTAGGAFLEWLEGKPLPGVAALRCQA